MLIKAQNICKSFSNKIENINTKNTNAKNLNEVLKNISIEIEKGKITTIMGASGVGKSNLLYILGTHKKPDSGSIILKKKKKNYDYSNLTEKEVSFIRNKHIGFIFQFHHLLPEFSVLENIMMPSLILGTPIKNIEPKALELMKKIGIEKIKNQKTTEISGGEQQRAAIARALINSPDIIFADEPTGNLDSTNANIVIELIKEINSLMNITFVIATHSNEIANQSDKVIKMQDGKII
jgi:lipoprotein-releasing system ATP-binding protein